ncbi:MAG TPA: hypothetical protein GXZ59_05660 [Clostridiaceae bacterium]|nr:hypothetical protein [Clostridiaceae bacterium]
MKQLYDHMKDKGLNPHFPGQYRGICEEPYTVILTGSQIPDPGTNQVGQRVIDILIYHPARSYVGMTAWINQVKNGLRDFKRLRRTGTETPILTEDEIKAYSSSIKYTILKELK